MLAKRLTGTGFGPTLRCNLSEFDLKGCIMRKSLFLGLLVGLALASGCATVTKTPAQNLADYRSIAEFDMRAMGDDWNALWLMDRQSRLTKWHTR